MKDTILIDNQTVELEDWSVEVALTNQYEQKTFQAGKPDLDFNRWLAYYTKDFPAGTRTSVRLILFIKNGLKPFNDWILEFNNPYPLNDSAYKNLICKSGQKTYQFHRALIQTISNELNSDKSPVIRVEVLCAGWDLETVDNSNYTPIITITGKTCSGKSTLERDLTECYQFNHLISHTTRLPRAGEINGVDYHFITPVDFATKTANGDWIEQVEFGGNKYGLDATQLSFDLPNVVVVEPHGVNHIQRWLANSDLKFKHYSIFLTVDPFVQADRFLTRIENGKETRNVLVKRLATMLGDETLWDGDKDHYDFVFEYNADTKESVLAQFNQFLK